MTSFFVCLYCNNIEGKRCGLCKYYTSPLEYFYKQRYNPDGVMHCILFYIMKVHLQQEITEKISTIIYVYKYILKYRDTIYEDPFDLRFRLIAREKLLEFSKHRLFPRKKAMNYLYGIFHIKTIIKLQRRMRLLRFLRWTHTKNFAEWFYAPENIGGKNAKYVLSKLV